MQHGEVNHYTSQTPICGVDLGRLQVTRPHGGRGRCMRALCVGVASTRSRCSKEMARNAVSAWLLGRMINYHMATNLVVDT